jgi:hypothetical protein
VNREFLDEAVRAEEEDACVPNIAAIGKHAFRACRLRLLDEAVHPANFAGERLSHVDIAVTGRGAVWSDAERLQPAILGQGRARCTASPKDSTSLIT